MSCLLLAFWKQPCRIILWLYDDYKNFHVRFISANPIDIDKHGTFLFFSRNVDLTVSFLPLTHSHHPYHSFTELTYHNILSNHIAFPQTQKDKDEDEQDDKSFHFLLNLSNPHGSARHHHQHGFDYSQLFQNVVLLEQSERKEQTALI